MITIKIKDGTPLSKNLCVTCSFFNKTEFHNGKTNMFCNNYDLRGDYDKRLYSTVAQCTGYEDKHYVPLYKLEKMAWILEASKLNKIGFLTPKSWKKKHGDDEDITPD